MRASLSALIAVAVALSLPACGISGPSANTDETFSATLRVGGQNVHNFIVGKSGEFTVKLTALSPDGGSIVGTAWGSPTTDGRCVPFSGYVNNFSTSNKTILGGPIQPGTFCIEVFDVGLLTAPQNYTLVVSHP